MIWLVWTWLVLFQSSSVAGQAGSVSPGVEFFKEEITLSVTDSTASAWGTFYFRNKTESDRPFLVMFPFHVDSVSSYPEDIRAFTVTAEDTAEIQFKRMPDSNSIILRIPMTARGVTVWHLNYTQRISSPQARYILSSTAAWGKPLAEATYRFVVPASFADVRTWPEPDSISSDGERRIYWCREKNFMPKRDMEIFFERK